MKLRSHDDTARVNHLSGRLRHGRLTLVAVTAVPVIVASAFLAAPVSAQVSGRPPALVRPPAVVRLPAGARPYQSSVYGLVNWDKRSDGKNMCMGSSAGQNNVDAVLWRCNGHPDQRWQFSGPAVTYKGVNYFYLVNDNHSCLGTRNRSVGEGASVVAETCHDFSSEFWAPITSFKTCEPYTAIVNLGAVKYGSNVYVVGVSHGEGNIHDGAPLVLWNFQRKCNNQVWNWILNNSKVNGGSLTP